MAKNDKPDGELIVKDVPVQPTTYHIVIEQQKHFNTSTGLWELRDVYSTPPYVKYHQKLIIQNGEAETTDPEIALELLDAGAQVTPDPRPYLQEKFAQELEIIANAEPLRLRELAKYVTETNAWRKANGFEPLSVVAPEVPKMTPVYGMIGSR